MGTGIRPHGFRSICAGRTTLQISVYGSALFGDLMQWKWNSGLRPAPRPTFTELYSESIVYRRLSPVAAGISLAIREPTRIWGCIAWLPKQYIETENRWPTYEPVSMRRFYRGGFEISGLRTLWSRMPISISCNVALGEPNH